MDYYQVSKKKEKLVSNSKWDDISFDDDIPLPTDVRSSDKYPWAKFPPPNPKTGQARSFAFTPDNDGIDTSKRLKNRIDQSLRTFIKGKEPTWRFISRVKLENDESVVRVWRLADENADA
mgnify:FL=1